MCVYQTRLESPYLHALNPGRIYIRNKCKKDLRNTVKAEKEVTKYGAWCKLKLKKNNRK